ncbi:MAG TPA: PP2C family protein-serine/threonine phosphatase [Acidobacteriaceae bacterium]|nr:PP2C family protein-serine/threonine phosphatase [Acidobacteriaceae bacterium]
MAAMAKPWYLRGPKRWQHFQGVPWKRLWLLMVAVFMLFSIFGLFYDLMALGTVPYAVVAVDAIYSGLNAAMWILVLARLPMPFIGVLIVLQFFNAKVMTWFAVSMTHAFRLTPVEEHTGVRVAALAMVGVVVTSYGFFVAFIRAEGRESYRLRTQLELAHGIQKTLVPPIVLRTELFEVYGISEPSEKVGGDLVDAVLLPNGDVVAYLADIAGHGLSAGILMGMLKTAARTALLDATTGHPSGTLPILLEKLNRVLPDVKEPQMYATLTAFRLNRDGSAWYATAASPPVLHWSTRGRDARRIEEQQYPLGLLPVAGFTGEAIELSDGDLLVVATDGVLEVTDKAGQEFGVGRVEEVIAGGAQGALEGMANTILTRARAFGRQADDQTLLMIRRL